MFINRSEDRERTVPKSWVYFSGLGDIIETKSKFDSIPDNKF